MDTFGEKLRSTRENKGYSLEQVARDTNIAKKFLTALEEENFAIFPGEPYLIGFLKNYSDYLGLDSGKMVSLHRNMKLQEQPLPIEELLDTGKSGVSLLLIIVLILAVAGASGVFLYIFIVNRNPEFVVEQAREVIEEDNVFSYDINAGDIEDRFSEGATLDILLSEEVYTVVIKEVSTNVIVSLPGGEILFNLGDEKTSDFNGDGIDDISIVLNDIDLNKKTVLVKLSLLEITTEEVDNLKLLDPGSSNIALRNKDVFVILDAKTPEPYIVDVIFRGNTLLRYLADRGERVEKYFDKGETLRLEVNREVMFWIANAGSFKAKISGIEVNVGRSGEVSTQIIKWNKNTESGKNELQMIPVY
ncbi:MAG: helix-turn-helix domain-containing protein [Spirochaetota bacterium]|nr:helix-turn-helix domain-containing protein [Spirochaetota bacterium]